MVWSRLGTKSQQSNQYHNAISKWYKIVEMLTHDLTVFFDKVIMLRVYL